MAINNKVKVAVIGAANKSILLNPQATEGAVFGKDLFYGDGKTVVTLQNLAQALGVTTQAAQPVILWNQLAAIPPNVLEVAALATAGVVRRLPSGKWITQPPSDFIGRPGVPGRHGHRGPPGIPGLKGPSGARGADGAMVPGRRGYRGRTGIPGPTGARGATGAQGPAGAASSASGFPGYRQRKPPRQHMKPAVDPSAGNLWPQTQTFLNDAKSIVLQNVNNPRIQWNSSGNATDEKKWQLVANGSGKRVTIGALNDAESVEHLGINLQRGTGTAIASLELGNTSDAVIFTLSNTQGTFSATTNQTLILNNASATAQTAIEFKANGTAVGRFRSDFAGNMNYVAFSTGVHAFYTGGDNGVGVNVLNIAKAGTNVAVLNNVANGGIQLQLNGVECITFSGAITAGGATILLPTNKPGSNNTTPSWLPVKSGGNQFYIPMWPG